MKKLYTDPTRRKQVSKSIDTSKSRGKTTTSTQRDQPRAHRTHEPRSSLGQDSFHFCQGAEMTQSQRCLYPDSMKREWDSQKCGNSESPETTTFVHIPGPHDTSVELSGHRNLERVRHRILLVSLCAKT